MLLMLMVLLLLQLVCCDVCGSDTSRLDVAGVILPFYPQVFPPVELRLAAIPTLFVAVRTPWREH
jgi:hypothetical protein